MVVLRSQRGTLVAVAWLYTVAFAAASAGCVLSRRCVSAGLLAVMSHAVAVSFAGLLSVVASGALLLRAAAVALSTPALLAAAMLVLAMAAVLSWAMLPAWVRWCVCSAGVGAVAMLQVAALVAACAVLAVSVLRLWLCVLCVPVRCVLSVVQTLCVVFGEH